MVLKVDFTSTCLLILQDLTLKEAEAIALSILKQVMEEKVSFMLLYFLCRLVCSTYLFMENYPPYDAR